MLSRVPKRSAPLSATVSPRRASLPSLLLGRPAPGGLRPALPPALLIALFSTLLIARLSPVLSGSEFALLGQWMAHRPPRTPDPHIVLVGIRQEDSDAYETERAAIHPECACAVVPRNRIGETVRRVKQAGARVVVLDLILGQVCPVHNPDHDGPLVAALDEQPVGRKIETIITVKANPTPDRVYFASPPQKYLGPGLDRLLASPVLYNPHGEIRGVRLIQVGSPSLTEQEQARSKGLELVGESVPPLCLAAFVAFQGDPCEVPVAAEDFLVNSCDLRIPVWPDGRIYLMEPFMSRPTTSMHIMLINWAGPAGTIPMLSLSAVNAADPQQLRQWFDGKIVIIGSAAERQNTPMPGAQRREVEPYVDQSGQRSMSGMEVHAQALDTILQHRFLRPLSLPTVWLLLFAACFLTSLAFLRLSLWAASLLAALGLALITWASNWGVSHDVWVYAVLPGAGVGLSAVATGLWGYARSRREAATLAEEVEVRDSTTATLVHDLKQPLAAISGLAAALRATQQSDRADLTSPELVQRIQRQVESALVDIDSLLLTTGAREVVLQPQRFDLAALARDLAVAQSLKSAVHEVRVEAPEGAVWLTADPRYVGRALSNLVDNAIKYWPEGGTVVVQVRDGEGCAEVRVVDRGLGMSPEQQARIFQRFGRAVPDGMAIPGTGLGLYSVKRIADAHGGHVSVMSRAGEGSVFILTLPDRACHPEEKGEPRC
jgi:signal transduction histidine kinase